MLMNNAIDQDDYLIKAIELTKNNRSCWAESPYVLFLETCSRQEFLNSQIPFYYAVEAFPRMLLQLAALITTSKNRLKVVENIWEEHGQGHVGKFHTSTFMSHLKALGMPCDQTLSHNPYISEWISSIMDAKVPTVSTLGTQLAAIEYMYALISQSITDYLDSIELECIHLTGSPAHYKKHSDIDWSHGGELLDVIVDCQQPIDWELFKKTQRDFIQLFTSMAFPTRKELERVAQFPVSFYYSREDSGVEKDVLLEVVNRSGKEQVTIFTVCSGGEHIFEMIGVTDKFLDITAFDVNPNQLNVMKDKLNGINSEAMYASKFEYLFRYLRNTVNADVIHQAKPKNNRHYQKAHFSFDKVFNKTTLNIVFGDEATKYSSQDFSEHFLNAILSSLESDNSRNILSGRPIVKKDVSMCSHYVLNYACDDLRSFDFTDRDYDIINISNIGDWMCLADYDGLLQKIKASVQPGTVVIARKLLGDYSLKALFSDHFSEVTCREDNTHFYTEVISGVVGG